MQSSIRLASAIIAGVPLFLAACSSTSTSDSELNWKQGTGSNIERSGNATAYKSPIGAIAAHLDPENPLAHRRTVYFDFDQAMVKPGYTSLLELHGRYLAANPNLTIRVEGNTDEQGGIEYNLALGQKRAAAVVSALKAFGVRDAQMQAVSYGEERPRELDYEEAAFKFNRRADLVYFEN